MRTGEARPRANPLDSGGLWHYKGAAMRASLPAALILAATSLVVHLGCKQDYAASNDGRDTFMGAVTASPPASEAPAPPPGPPPTPRGFVPPAPPPMPEGGTDGAVEAGKAPAAPAPPHAH